MKGLIRWMLMAAVLCGVPALWAADPSGAYKGAFEFNGSSTPVTLNLKIAGTSVTGTVEGLPTSPAEIKDGKIDGDAITFSVNTEYQGQTYKLVYKGKVSGDHIDFDFGTDDGSWGTTLSVKKEGAAPTPAADVSGAWKGSFDFNGTSMPLTFNLKSSGSTVTGTVEGMGPAPVEIHEGKIDGDTVTFWLNTDYQGQTYVLTYKGKITDGQIAFDFGTADGGWGASVTVKKS